MHRSREQTDEVINRHYLSRDIFDVNFNFITCMILVQTPIADCFE